jgi:hypothetical protein
MDTVVHGDIIVNGFTYTSHGEVSDNRVDLYPENQNDVPHFLKNVLFNTATHFSILVLTNHLQKNFYSNSDTWFDRRNAIRFVLIPEDLDIR